MSILIYFATIFWSLFPNLIHVFQGGENYINKVNETNLVVNSDLSLDTNDDGVPDGFTYTTNTITKTLVNGVATFTATSQFSNLGFINTNSFTIDDTYYIFSSFKSSSSDVRLLTNQPSNFVYHSGSNEFEFHSYLTKKTNTNNGVYIEDNRSNDFTPISVDYIGAYNVSTMKLNGVKSDDGILFSDLTNEEIRLQLDAWINDYGDLDFAITKDNTHDQWFHTGFVEKTAERDFLDYLGYFFWLMTPPIILFLTLDLIRRII